MFFSEFFWEPTLHGPFAASSMPPLRLLSLPLLAQFAPIPPASPSPSFNAVAPLYASNA